MIANRKAVKAGMRRLYRTCRVREVEDYGSLLRRTLTEMAPGGRPDPILALLTPGTWNSAFYEHMFLAQEIGAELFEGQDLLVNDGFVGPHSTPKERDEFSELLRANPADYISQPTLPISRSPCLVDGRAEPRHVDLRPFVLTGTQTRIVPGAFCRVALRRGSLVVNSSQGGGGKDLWVVDL